MPRAWFSQNPIYTVEPIVNLRVWCLCGCNDPYVPHETRRFDITYQNSAGGYYMIEIADTNLMKGMHLSHLKMYVEWTNSDGAEVTMLGIPNLHPGVGRRTWITHAGPDEQHIACKTRPL